MQALQGKAGWSKHPRRGAGWVGVGSGGGARMEGFWASSRGRMSSDHDVGAGGVG